MKTVQTLLTLIEPVVFMASTDLKDVKTTKNVWRSFVKDDYKFFSMPNGYGPILHTFTKMTKILFTHLRKKDPGSAFYVDGSYLQGKTYE